MLAEWALRAPAFEGLAHSVYFGGGTPSLAPPPLIAALLEALPAEPEAEHTLEANPGTITEERLLAYREAGINRVSVGIQTFNPRFAHLLNRGHSVAQARELALLVARGGFRSWSVDVIFALPGQSEADFGVDLEAILALDPPHVSLYGLTFEPGTPFGRAEAQGRIQGPDADTWRSMYDLAVDTLQTGGWERYEVSNFARTGHRAVHNEAVWRGGFYAGLGPGAHGYEPDGHRTVNRADVQAWRADPTETRTLPSPREAAIDLVLSTLRHEQGLALAELLARTGFRVRLDALGPLLTREARIGDGPPISHTDGHLRLAPHGFPVADGIVARICDVLVEDKGS